jgi:hypothetical protein
VTPLAGSCLCGAVRFEIAEPFDVVAACHCASCKKLSGGGGTASGRAPTAAIRIVSGAESVTTYQPEEGSAKTFCRTCGSNLFGGGWPESEYTFVRLPTLDPPYEGRIQRHIFVRSRAPWEILPDDGAEQYETRPG